MESLAELYVMMSRLALAALLCGVIGLEREVKRHPAGFRTHLLVGVGSCLMMLLSLFGFENYLNQETYIQFDPARIPSYVISGIGFLGAGTILVKGATIKGLTTAASIWVVAGLGLVIGAGMYELALFTTFIVLLSLIFLNKIEAFIYKKMNKRWIKVILKSGELNTFISELERLNIVIKKIYLNNTKRNKENEKEFYYVLEIISKEYKDTQLLKKLSNVKGIHKVF